MINVSSSVMAHGTRRTFQQAVQPPASVTEPISATEVTDTHETYDTLVEQHLGLVMHVARRYAKRYQGQHILDLDDLVQEGMLGLIRAAEKFDVQQGFQFSTYATFWIRQAIRQAIMTGSRTIRLPDTIWSASRRLAQVQAVLWQQYRREPSLDELAEAMQSEQAQVLVLLQHQQQMLSLEQPVYTEHEGTETTLVGEQIAAPDDTEERERHQEVADLLKHLTRQERQVIELRYQLGTEAEHGIEDIPLAYSEVGRRLRMTSDLVKAVETRALRKMRFWVGRWQRLGRAQPIGARQ